MSEKFVLVFVFVSFFLALEAVTRSQLGQFNEFKKNFNKIYKSSSEERQRRKIFLKNVAMIENHNSKFRRALSTYSMRINDFADLSEDEFDRFANGTFVDEIVGTGTDSFLPPDLPAIPESIDWRVLGAVTRVKNQKKCGSCWAFTTVGALEGQHFLKTGKLISLSAQNLIDCVKNVSTGCNGGLKERAFQYVVDNGGIATAKSYPYEGKGSAECRFENATIGATSYGYVNVTRRNETILTAAVALKGPISVSVDMQCLKAQFYGEGIIQYDVCKSRRINHSMLIVGYGYDEARAQSFWILKNSWGRKWGMGGYMKIPRFTNFAGIASRPVFPLV